MTLWSACSLTDVKTRGLYCLPSGRSPTINYQLHARDSAEPCPSHRCRAAGARQTKDRRSSAASAILAALLLSSSLHCGNAFHGVAQGDSHADFYLNGAYLQRDESLTAVPMNGNRRVDISSSPTLPLMSQYVFNEGDVLAMNVYTLLKTTIPYSDELGFVNDYHTFPSAIAAFEDGTMTSTDWLCTTEYFEGWANKDFDWETPLNDTYWKKAIEAPAGCCPWNDEYDHWHYLHAKWISAQGMYTREAVEGRRSFRCRYTIPAQGSRLPPYQAMRLSADAPQVRITELVVSSSMAQIWLTVDQDSTVYCGFNDPRYELRNPTPEELVATGISEQVVARGLTWFTAAVDTDRPNNGFTLEWLDVATLEVCKSECMEYDGCVALTWYAFGFDPVTGKRCKLMKEFDADNMADYTYPGLSLTHVYLADGLLEHQLIVTGILSPGTLYNVFCAAESLDKSSLSNWTSVANTKTVARTQGCVDCGTEAPDILIHGGWASVGEINVVVSSSRVGRIFCTVRSGTLIAPTAQDILEDDWYSMYLIVGRKTVVSVHRLAPGVRYYTFCVAESDGGVTSSQALIDASRRLWLGGTTVVPISTMSVEKANVNDFIDISVTAKMTETGYVWCHPASMKNMTRNGNGTVPYVTSMMWLYMNAARQKIEDIRLGFSGEFKGLPADDEYEVYCTAWPSDFQNDSQLPGITAEELPSPNPKAYLLSSQIVLDSLRFNVLISKGPSRTRCKMLPWEIRPRSKPPATPTPEDFDLLPYMEVEVQNKDGAFLQLRFEELMIGTPYDLYCYTQEMIQDLPPDGSPPPRVGMTQDDIDKFKRSFMTEGPQRKTSGWVCIAGKSCTLQGLYGYDLSRNDKMLTRTTRCPGKCRCSGKEDQWNKGAECSSVLQGPGIMQPPPGFEKDSNFVDAVDPGGIWCYVDPTDCDDEDPSSYTGIMVSRLACSYEAPVGLPNSGVDGFPKEGIVRRQLMKWEQEPTAFDVNQSGYDFSYGDEPVMADGWVFQMCWCNATLSQCRLEEDYFMDVGLLHVSGPSDEQRGSEMSCIRGAPCHLTGFKGHALHNSSRLAVLVATPDGCARQRDYAYEPLTVHGFPNGGVSDPATDDGKTYSWGSLPVESQGGKYLLCWCGAIAQENQQHRRRTSGRGDLPKNMWSECEAARPDGGSGFLAPAGLLSVLGPEPFHTRCMIGFECRFNGVPGYGQLGGDLMAIMKTCGDGAIEPVDWRQGIVGEMPSGWQTGGWMQYGKQQSERELFLFGAPVMQMQTETEAGNHGSRGVWGTPNRGISSGSTRNVITSVGEYRWKEPIWALPGEYKLCWCAAGRSLPCFEPAHFIAEVGVLTVYGATVLPASHQVLICLRGRRCEVSLLGTSRQGSKLFMAKTECGGEAALAVPGNGFSLQTIDSSSFSWGDDPMQTFPGRYPLCLCDTLAGPCTEPKDYTAFAGVLSMKGPTQPTQSWLCGLQTLCNISNIVGEGFNDGDRVKVMTVCGAGQSTATIRNGGVSVATYQLGDDVLASLTFTLPPAHEAGTYEVCYCPAESLCGGGADYFVSLGGVSFGGPDPSRLYACYEHRPCAITMAGQNLRDGDRLRVIPHDAECGADSLPTVDGWPSDGVSAHATNVGSLVTWGKEDDRETYVVVEPGMYKLCWCSAHRRSLAGWDPPCKERGPYNIFAGSLRIEKYQMYQFATKEDEPPRRSFDFLYPLLLAGPLGFVMIIALCCGWRKITTRGNAMQSEAPPLFKKHVSFFDEAQEKAKRMFEVVQVMKTRLDLEGHRKAQISPADMPSYISGGPVACRNMRRGDDDSIGTPNMSEAADPETPPSPLVGGRLSGCRRPALSEDDVFKPPTPAKGVPAPPKDGPTAATKLRRMLAEAHADRDADEVRRVLELHGPRPPRYDSRQFGYQPKTLEVLNWEQHAAAQGRSAIASTSLKSQAPAPPPEPDSVPGPAPVLAPERNPVAGGGVGEIESNRDSRSDSTSRTRLSRPPSKGSSQRLAPAAPPAQFHRVANFGSPPPVPPPPLLPFTPTEEPPGFGDPSPPPPASHPRHFDEPEPQPPVSRTRHVEQSALKQSKPAAARRPAPPPLPALPHELCEPDQAPPRAAAAAPAPPQGEPQLPQQARARRKPSLAAPSILPHVLGEPDPGPPPLPPLPDFDPDPPPSPPSPAGGLRQRPSPNRARPNVH